MLHFSSPPPPTMNGRALPQRSDCLRLTPESALLSALPDELHDMRRVQAYGQEDDLKEALGKTIARIEDLSALLSQAHKTHTELETSLKLARSNLQLALANNEMLEEALKRESAIGSKDVGWRRRNDRPESRQGHSKEQSTEPTHPPSRRGSASVVSTPTSEASSAPVPASASTSPVPPKPASPAPPAVHDTRFFRFRFGSSSASTSPNPNSGSGLVSRPQTPPLPLRRPGDAIRERDASHLTSASLPTLVASTGKREEELVAELEAERAKYVKVRTEKSNLEQELEGLSQALFEEANKMVAHERIKCAEIEEELRQVRQEKEALKSAMRVIEQENARLKSPASVHSPAFAGNLDAGFDDDNTALAGPSAHRSRSRSRSPDGRSQSTVSSSEATTSSRSRSRSASPSSTQACRRKSSSSERGWASPEPETETDREKAQGADSGMDNEHGLGRGPLEKGSPWAL